MRELPERTKVKDFRFIVMFQLNDKLLNSL